MIVYPAIFPVFITHYAINITSILISLTGLYIDNHHTKCHLLRCFRHPKVGQYFNICGSSLHFFNFETLIIPININSIIDPFKILTDMYNGNNLTKNYLNLSITSFWSWFPVRCWLCCFEHQLSSSAFWHVSKHLRSVHQTKEHSSSTIVPLWKVFKIEK